LGQAVGPDEQGEMAARSGSAGCQRRRVLSALQQLRAARQRGGRPGLQTLSRARPFERRARITARPPRVRMRTRKPWVRLRRVTEG
jgi:hypothetical protein